MYFALVQVLDLKKMRSLVCGEQDLGPHLWFTGHSELLIKSLMEESPPTSLVRDVN